ncbi:50S ribosome-binding GTPase, partial [bacterium]|nr:50S ribosome-binding GTPase [bacterium]
MEKLFLPEDIRFERGFDNPEELENFLSNLSDSQKALCFVGRSNVGKSSLINALFKNGMAKVSNTPGRTREINVFSFIYQKQEYLFFDLPGYGYAKISKSIQKLWRELIVTFFESIPPSFIVIAIQDARHPFQSA